MSGISRGRGQLLYQFPLYAVSRRGDSRYYEQVTQYLLQDSEDPTRALPPPPQLARVKATVEREAQRFPATNPPHWQSLIDSPVLFPPMEVKTDIFPATFYCLSCGKVLHVPGSMNGVPPPSSATKRALEQFTRDSWFSKCRDCSGQVEQWRFLTTHWSGEVLSDLNAWNIRCPTHHASSLRLFGMHKPQLKDWAVRCEAAGCDHFVNGIRGPRMNAESNNALPSELRGKPFAMNPIERKGSTIPRVVTIPLATNDLAPPPAGSLVAQRLVADLVGGATSTRTWRTRPRTEQDTILERMRDGGHDTPDAAEAELVEMNVLQPLATEGPTDGRASDLEALEQAAIYREVKAKGTKLESRGHAVEVIHHSSVPVSTVLYGYSRLGFDPKESILRFYTQKSHSGAPRAVFYYHTGTTEGLLARFGPLTPSPTQETRDAVHTLSHAFMRAIGEVAGFGETSLTEYVLTNFNATLIMPTSGQDLVLNLLRNAWQDNSPAIMARVRELVDVCPADSYCDSQDSHCAQCVVLPWHCCNRQNYGLSRRLARAMLRLPAAT